MYFYDNYNACNALCNTVTAKHSTKKNALEIDCIIKYIENYIIVVEIHFDAYRKKKPISIQVICHSRCNLTNHINQLLLHVNCK